MKNRLFAVTVIMLVVVWNAPAMAFLNYLFGGSSNEGAIEELHGRGSAQRGGQGTPFIISTPTTRRIRRPILRLRRPG